MPWGWECRAKLIKQVPAKPVERRGAVSGETKTPGPNNYEAPQIFCGKGYSKIKRAPAYTFGHRTKISLAKPVTTPYAPLFNVQGMGIKGGQFRITHSVVTPHIEPISDKSKKPGPAAYAPNPKLRYKRPPAYSIRRVAKPPYQAWDMWTPPPNMYWPPAPCKKPPAYTLGYMPRSMTKAIFPAPGEHDPNFDFVKKKKPAYSFGGPFKESRLPKLPAPNTYCEKKFMVAKRTIPAPSFGIRHSPYLGKFDVPLKSSKLDLIAREV
ncbi:ciliary microtubule associated protein 1A [Amyelois transitella]|uniref:ciliary microtubule associated protein 1A n=1 Tax=Amyelois transitella TaxID=680683 RepID=UPI00067AB466|nr:ciliary microtubule associated protein 1A [Amyelois transitella]